MPDITIYNGRSRDAIFAETPKGRAWILNATDKHFDGGRAFTCSKEETRDIEFLAKQDGLEVEIK
jgi:hypothetical protein